MLTAYRQQGVVLIITLLMLVVLSLLGIAAVNSGTVNLRIVDNMRTSQEQETAAQQALERMISDGSNFNSKAPVEITIGPHLVTVQDLGCIHARPSPGSSARIEGSQDVATPEFTYWDFRACVSDNGGCFSQGVRMRKIADQCQPLS